MKKLLLLAAAALTLVACKKDNDETPPGPCIEPASPYTVAFDYPKTIVSEENGSTSTITYTVTDLLPFLDFLSFLSLLPFSLEE